MKCRGTLFKQVQSALSDRILSGELSSGDMLPREEDLCREFTVSRVTVRKALDLLKKEGLIASKKRSGTVVVYRGSKRSNIAGIVVPNSWQSLYAGVVHSLERALAAQNIDLMLRNTGNDPRREEEGIASVLRRKADVLVLVWDKRSFENMAVIRDASRRIPIIIIDAHLPDIRADHIASDHRTGARLATEHLIASGAKRLLHIRGTNGVWSADERAAGFLDACRKAGIGKKSSAMIMGHFDETSASRALTRHLANGGMVFDGVFATTDMTAFAAQNVLAGKGITAPDDVRIIGFGNDYGVQREAYGISTVDQHPDRLGTAVAKRCIERMNGASAVKNMTLLPVSVIERRSSAAKEKNAS